jgi:hypothetical protein
MTRAPSFQPREPDRLSRHRTARASFALLVVAAFSLTTAASAGGAQPQTVDTWFSNDTCYPVVNGGSVVPCSITTHANLTVFGICNDDGACPFTINLTAVGRANLPGEISVAAHVLMDVSEGAHTNLCVNDPTGTLTVSTPDGCAPWVCRSGVFAGTFVTCAGKKVMVDYVTPGTCDDVWVLSDVEWNVEGGAYGNSDFMLCENPDHTSFILPGDAPYPFPVGN